MTPPLAQDLDGFTPGTDPLVYAVDLYHGEVDRLRKLLYDGGDNTALIVAKLTEGQAPESISDERLAQRTFDGCVEIVKMAMAHGIPWTVYHYATPGRCGRESRNDAGAEAAWFDDRLHALSWELQTDVDRQRIAQLNKVLDGVEDGSDADVACKNALVRETARFFPTHRVWLDLEDKHTPLDGFGLEMWCCDWLDRVGQTIKCAVYTYTSYAKRLPEEHGLFRWPLIQAHYHNNDPNRVLEAPPMANGWQHRAGWQYTSKDRGGLDRNVVRLSALEVGP